MEVLLLEDDHYFREFFKKLLYELPEVKMVRDTGNSQEAIKLTRLHQPDLIILDIELVDDEMNGLQVAQQIYSFNKEAYLLFLTAYSQYAISSFAVHPYSYILKPIVIEEFKSIVKEIADEINLKQLPNTNALCIKIGRKKYFICQDDIFFIEVQNKQCIIHTKSEKLAVNKTLEEIKKQLNDNFIRVHRSYIVNVKQIKSIQEIWDRTYAVDFLDYPYKARMSRNEYQKNSKYFT